MQRNAQKAWRSYEKEWIIINNKPYKQNSKYKYGHNKKQTIERSNRDVKKSRKRRGNAIPILPIITTSCTKIELNIITVIIVIIADALVCVLYMCVAAFPPNASVYMCEQWSQTQACTCFSFFFSWSAVLMLLLLLFLFCCSCNYQIIGFQSGRISSTKWWFCPCIRTDRARAFPCTHRLSVCCCCSIHFISLYIYLKSTTRLKHTHTLIKSNVVYY